MTVPFLTLHVKKGTVILRINFLSMTAPFLFYNSSKLIS